MADCRIGNPEWLECSVFDDDYVREEYRDEEW